MSFVVLSNDDICMGGYPGRAHLHDLVWIDEKGLLAPETDLALSTASASAMQS